MENIVIGVLLLAILGAAIWYIVRSKKKGKKCIGCPYSDQCSSKCCSPSPKDE